MNTRDRFDDQITERLRADAPREAPSRILDATMGRIAETPQRGGGWMGRPVARLLAAAAVLLLAVLAGTQLPGLIGRPVGDDSSPSPSVMPSQRSAPSATVVPSPAPATPQPSESPAAADGLLLRVVNFGGGPTSPSQLLPWITLMADGTLIWQPITDATQTGSLVARSLTEEGLADLRDRIFGSGLLDTSATHELELQPGAEPLGRGVGVYAFTAGDGPGQVVVTSVQWLGDDEEATYYQPAPERRELDQLAQQLRDPESLLGPDAWAGPAQAYEARDYQLVLTSSPDTQPFDTSDASEIPWPFEGPLDQFGQEVGDSRPPTVRCGAISRDEAAQIIDALASLGYGQIGTDRATIGSLDWADGNGTLDVWLIPRMPDGFPGCEDQF